MNNELERINKEAVVAYLMYYTGLYLDGLRKATKNLRIAGLRVET
jgi:hypothetical protein